MSFKVAVMVSNHVNKLGSPMAEQGLEISLWEKDFWDSEVCSLTYLLPKKQQ